MIRYSSINLVKNAGGFSSDAHERLNFFSDLDQSLEHCEDKIVATKMGGADQAELQDVRKVKDDLMQAVYNDVMERGPISQSVANS